MKKGFYIIFIFVTLLLFLVNAIGTYKQYLTVIAMSGFLEKLSYIMGAICVLMFFDFICKRSIQNWIKSVVGATISLFYTALIIVYNSFLQFLHWNFSWYFIQYYELMPYKRFFNESINYSWHRYIIIEIMIIFGFIAIAVIHIDKFKNTFNRCKGKVLSVLDYFWDNDEEE